MAAEIISAIPVSLQAIGLMIPVFACGFVQFNKNQILASDIFQKTKFFDETSPPHAKNQVPDGINLPTFKGMEFMVHDHELNDIVPGKGELVVELRKGGVTGDLVATVAVKEKDVTVSEFVPPGGKIPGTDIEHDNNGSKKTGPWEYNDEPQATS
jgi:hypothetical protein